MHPLVVVLDLPVQVFVIVVLLQVVVLQLVVVSVVDVEIVLPHVSFGLLGRLLGICLPIELIFKGKYDPDDNF